MFILISLCVDLIPCAQWAAGLDGERLKTQHPKGCQHAPRSTFGTLLQVIAEHGVAVAIVSPSQNPAGTEVPPQCVEAPAGLHRPGGRCQKLPACSLR